MAMAGMGSPIARIGRRGPWSVVGLAAARRSRPAAAPDKQSKRRQSGQTCSNRKIDSGSAFAGVRIIGVAAPRVWLGKRIGRFRLLALLGQGGMGRVFRAEDLMSRHVALKVLPRTIKKGP